MIANQLNVVPAYIEQIMTHAFGVDILTKPQRSGPDVQLLGSPNGLFDQIDAPDENAESMVILAPYFDPKGEAVLNLVDKFKPKDFRVITDKRRTNLCTIAAEAIRSGGGKIQFLDVDNERPLHAKIVLGIK